MDQKSFDSISWASKFNYVAVQTLFLLISVPFRMLEKKFKYPFSTKLMTMLFGTCFGILVAHVPYLDTQFIAIGKDFVPDLLLGVCLSCHIMSIIYRLEYYVVLRSLPMALLATVMNMIINVLLLGWILKEFVQANWAYTSGVMAAAVITPIQPNKIIELLKELSKFNYMSTILAAESILILIPVFITLDICIGYADNIICEWYQCICILIRLVLLSMILGAIFGKIATTIMCLLYHDSMCALNISISFTYLTYFIGQQIIGASGCLSVITFAWIVSMERHRFSEEADKLVSEFWVSFSFVIDICIQTNGVVEIVRLICKYSDLRVFFYASVPYVAISLSRLMVYLILGLVLRKMSYDVNMRCAMILGWSGIKGSHCLLLILKLVTNRSTQFIGLDYIDKVLVLVLLTHFINNATIRLALKLIGLDELSSSRKTNMNNCMKFIMDKRNIILNILKTNKYMMYAQWNLVRLETIIKHPYSLKNAKGNEYKDGEDDLPSDVQGTILCPDCLNEVAADISEKEIFELINDARAKIIKAKKVKTIKQFESGMIDKQCMHLLLHTFEMLLELSSKNKAIDISYYFKSSKFLETIRKILLKLHNDVQVEVPKTQFRKLMYFIFMHIGYDYIHCLIILLYALLVLLSQTTQKIYFNNVAHLVFCLGLLIDLIIKLIGLTTEKSIFSGFKHYFKFIWYCFDLMLLLAPLFGFLIMWIGYLDKIKRFGKQILIYSSYVRVLRVLYLFRFLLPTFIRMIENKVDSKICFGYQLAIALENCHKEILNLITQILDVKIIRDMYVKELVAKKQTLQGKVEQIQRRKPWIAVTFKTKQVIRTTIFGMEESLNQLKTSGFVDNFEYEFIYKGIFEKKNFLRKLKFVRSSSPKVIFKEVPWMDDITFEYLYKNVSIVAWDAGQVICTEGKFSKGIYIIVRGLLRIKYTPKEVILKNSRIYGQIPIIDYLSKLDFEKHITDIMMSGNSFGELSLLTGRPYDCTIIADTTSQAFLITPDLIKKAMKLNRDPITGLASRMWKCVTLNLAIAALVDVPMYKGFDVEQLKFKFEKAFTPNLKCYKTFEITEMMSDVILIEGVAADYITREYFTAPTVIPRSIQKLILSRSSFMNKGEGTETRLFIIPFSDIDIYDIMENEEKIADLVSVPSSKCLLHAVQEKRENKKYIKHLIDDKEMDENILSKASNPCLEDSNNSKLIEVIDPQQSEKSIVTMLTIESSDVDDVDDGDHFDSSKTKRYILRNKKIESQSDDHIV